MVKEICVPSGIDVSGGTCKHGDCGYKYSNQSKTSFPPWSNFEKSPHPKRCWAILTG